MLVFSGTQIKPQIIIHKYYLPDYLFFFCYYENKMCFSRRLQQALKQELILKQCVNQSNLTVTLLQIRTDFKNDFEKKTYLD